MLTRRTLIGGTTAALLSAPVVAQAAPSGRTATASVPRRKPVPLRFPRPTGPFPVGATELHLVDHDRDDAFRPGRVRELMISIWYPAAHSRGERAPYLPPLTAQRYAEDAAVALEQPVGTIDWVGARSPATLLAPVATSWGRRPVVLFSPGFGVPRGLNSIHVAELASRGYVVVTIDHTYETAAVEFPGGRLEVQTLPPEPFALTARQIRVEDFGFVLDQLTRLAAGDNPDAERRRLPAGLGRLLDLRRVGAYGHSAGGITSLEVMLTDRRVRAGINLDGTLGYGYDDPADAPTSRGIDRPFLLVGAGGTGPNRGPQTHLTQPSWGLAWDHSTGWKRDLLVPEGMHFTFADNQALLPYLERFIPVPEELSRSSIGTVDPDSILRTLRAVIPGFFDQHLRDRPCPGLWRDSPRHPDVRFID